MARVRPGLFHSTRQASTLRCILASSLITSSRIDPEIPAPHRPLYPAAPVGACRDAIFKKLVLADKLAPEMPDVEAAGATAFTRLRLGGRFFDMDENTPIGPQAEETNFVVWSAARRIGTARKSPDGCIVVKLDPDEIVKSGNLFTLYPLR